MDRSTESETQPVPEQWSPESEQLRAAFALAGVTRAELPQPALGDQVGRYTVLSRLGQGGMGVVYKAYDPQLDRNVALKLLRRVIHDDEQGSDFRLLREAQTLAQLQHPNVVAVFDAGLTGHGVFIAMELVEGQTLRHWLAKRRRTSEILAVFRAAGRGLAAAHEAGFVHRDFKPSNVIVSDDGSVRVLDFGVASLMDSRVEGRRSPTGSARRVVSRPPGAVEPLSISSSDLQLTDDGVIMGTPAYMAPEQLDGDKADHRSEQFTFCVCLHLALYGRSPVIGESFEERRWNMVRGRVLDERGMLTGRTPGRVPARVRRVLRRGLSIPPGARFPSMRALLDELEDPPRRRPLVIVGSMLAFGFGVGAAVFDAPDPCAAPADALGQVWDDADRDAVRAAFAGSGHRQATELYQRVEQQLDRYAQAWTTMHTESCHATFVARRQSEPLHDQRLRCLERRRNRLRSTIDALGRVEDSKQLVDRTLLPFQLPLVADCADLHVVGTALPLPSDPALRERIAELRRSIDEVETLELAGDVARGLELARTVVERAQETGFSPVIAEALGSLGSLQAKGGSALEAQATLEATILEAAKVGDDATAAKAWTWLIYALLLQGRTEQGRALELAAQAAVERADLDHVRGWLLNNLGALYGADQRFEQALAYLVEAIEVKQRTLGDQHVDVGISWFNLGTVLAEHERHAEAHDALARARAIFEATVGQAHPLTFHAIGGLCAVEYGRERYDTAIELCGRVLAHYEVSRASQVTMGRNHFLMAQALHGAGSGDEARVRARTALQLVRAEDPALAQAIERWLETVAREPRSRSPRRP